MANTILLFHQRKPKSESKMGYNRNSVIWCCYQGCCLRTILLSLPAGELAENLN